MLSRMRAPHRISAGAIIGVVVLLGVYLAPAAPAHAAAPQAGSFLSYGAFLPPNPTSQGSTATGPASAPRTVANSQAGDVSSTFDLLNGTVAHVPVPFETGNGPVAIAADPSNGLVYVVDQTSGNLAVLNATTGAFVKWIPVGFWPTSIAYDGVTKALYVTKPLVLNISVLNGTGLGVSATINYVDGPSSVTVDTTNNATGSLVVTGQSTHAVFWIGGANLSTFWSTDPGVPDSPYLSAPVAAIAVQPSVWPSAQLLVSDFGTSYLEEFCNLHESSQYYWSACAAPAVGSHPDGLAYDTLNQEVYVANSGSDNVTVLSAVVTGTTVTMPVWRSVGSIPVGTSPEAIAFDPHNGNLFVVNEGSNNVSVIDGATNKVIGTVAVGSAPDAMSFDPANDNVYVANYLSDNVSVFNASNYSSLAERLSVRTAFTPVSLAFNGAEGQLDVLSSDSNQVLSANVSTGVVIGSGTLNLSGWTGVGTGQLVYDPTDHQVYGVQVSGAGVLDLNGSGTTTIPTGVGDSAIGFDPVGTPVLFVLNLSGGVLVLNGSTPPNLIGSGTLVLGGGTVGGSLVAVGVDLATGVVYLANRAGNDVIAVSWAPSTGLQTLGTVAVSAGPAAVAYDPSNGHIYVADRLANNVSVLAPTPANPVGSVVATIPVGTAPSAIAFDPQNGLLYVANSGSNTLSVINGSSESVVGTIAVGAAPSALAVGGSGTLYVGDANDSAVTIVSVATYPVTFTESGLPAGTSWSVSVGSVGTSTGAPSVTVQLNNGSFGVVSRLLSESGIFYYFDHDAGGHSLVTVSGGPQVVHLAFQLVRTYPLQLRERGLPAGVPWGATVRGVNLTNTTVARAAGAAASMGALSFAEPLGPVNFSLNPPPGYGVASVIGPGSPNQTYANLTRSTTWTVTFGALEPLSFAVNPNVKFEPFVAINWSVTVTSLLRSGPPSVHMAAYPATVVGPPGERIVRGALYKYEVLNPDPLYAIAPPSGHLRFGSALSGPPTTFLRFYERTWTKVFFNMTGLPLGSDWYLVLVGGPSGAYKYPYAVEAKPGKMGIPAHVKQIEIILSAGTYHWMALAVATGWHISGTLTVTLPGPDYVPVPL